ncbi:P27 family phage terminase small subunit [Methylorubrum populi]|nr:P27 family phage terminase small subunit [Methylorubrum rhodesianum]MBY0141855.1 P27 family phage terminase small subunit [Methylorubrum populi]
MVTKADAPAVPKGLTKAARAEWDRVAPVLRDRGGLPGEREPLLVAYCNAMALIAECDKSLSKRGGLMIKGANGIERVHPLFGARNKASQNALQLAKRLGIIGSGAPAKPTGGDEHDAYSDLGI